MKTNIRLALITFLLASPFVQINAQKYTAEELGFDPGEYELISSPFKEDFDPLLIPRFRNILRLGKQDSYGLTANPRSQEIYRSQKERGSVLAGKERSILKLFELMEIHQRRDDISLEDIGSSFRIPVNARAPADDPARKNDYWSNQLKRMAPEYLKAGTLAKYWCKEGENCLVEGRQPGTYASASNKRGRPTWGGGSDEFAQLRAWQAYVKTEVPKILKWAALLNEQEAYIVGTAYIREYDFNHEGFVIRVDAVEPKATRSSLITYPKKRDDDSFFALSKVNGNVLSGKLIKMNPEQAEKLIETMEANNPPSREVYYVYKVTLRFITPEDSTKIYYGEPPKFTQEPASEIVEFFLDEQLNQKLFEADFSK